ncbi:MAG: AAA family ATPase [Euryarchaeota archaeon]|nr:AAA family ATPase [Euryarchaeota archaeon]
MEIESFVIKNYKSIKDFEMDNLNPVNVFFGKNNVGKSNILRGLHLAFYILRNDEIFLPDTMFHNRNIYKPIEITVDLILKEDFCDTEEISNDLDEGIENIRSVVVDEETIFRDIITDIEEFIDVSKSFKPLKKLRLRTCLDYNEETCDARVSIEDVESDYKFNYLEYKDLYKKLDGSIRKTIRDEKERTINSFLRDLSIRGVEIDKIQYPISLFRDYYFDPSYISVLRDHINRIKDPANRNEAMFLLNQYMEETHEPRDLFGHFSETFNIVKKYFEKISDNFILIPNVGYFPKGPLAGTKSSGTPIKIFDIERFYNKLRSLIESPGKKDRALIHQFNNVFGGSYADMGELEIRKFREEVFAIFDTGFTSLPIENQGQGVQDLFLYLTHTILFDSAIIAIEEPEGGLSTENQRILHGIIEDVYSRRDKQIFIASHSEEFESPNSYVIEMDRDGTREIGRMEQEKEYERKIDEVLVKRRLEEEKERYQALLKEITERQTTLDVLNYIDKLESEEEIDAQKISSELGYKEATVQEVLKKILKEG